MIDRDDSDRIMTLTDAEEWRLQLTGCLASALSLLGALCVLVHFASVQWCTRTTPRRSRHLSYEFPRCPLHTDFMDKLVFILALFDLIISATRAVGRSVVHDLPLCRAQAAILEAASLASCSWICCMTYNIYRWIVGGESNATRQKRLPLFLATAVVPGAAIVVYDLMTNKYGDATFYCWLDEIRYMFVNFYLLYLLMIIFNIVLLALIHSNMKQRVAMHDTVEADISSMLIRRKLVLYIVIFIAHRTPMMIYRSALPPPSSFHFDTPPKLTGLSLQVLEARGMNSLSVGLTMQVIQDLNGFSNSIVYGGLCRGQAPRVPSPSDCEAESIFSPPESSVRGFAVKKRPVGAEDDHEGTFYSPATLQSQSDRPISCESDGEESSPDNSAASRKAQARKQDEHGHRYRSWHQRLQERFSLHHEPPPPPAPAEPNKIAIFVSTFNMGEKKVNENELSAWIPLGHDVYVIGVQECMDLSDFQFKILRHLVSGSSSKYVHYSREIGKRATALGYHGYIALCIFVRATAVASGRFCMPHRQSNTKHAQEVYRGKSLLLFGRASNKGAVGISFRFDDTSFAFVTCHLASDSSRHKRATRKRSSHSFLQAQKADSSSMETSMLQHSECIGRNSGGSKASLSDGPTSEMHQPASNLERRNQDAMEILQQLYLDNEDYGFGFSHLHHHSFILGDFNYRMTRKGATPVEMLELLVNAATKHHQPFKDVYATAFASLCSQHKLYTPRSDLSPHPVESDFQKCITPIVQSLTPIVATQRNLSERARISARDSGLNSTPFVLRSLVEEHDELYQLCRSQQVFHGFKENEITFFPTFRRIRGQALQEPLDAVTFHQNFSLVAAHGGYRVPSYTDRVFYSSLAGTQDALRCLVYDSCEAVTTSDHKPVSACFEVALLTSTTKSFPAPRLIGDPLLSSNSRNATSVIALATRSASPQTVARMKDVPGACELCLRIEFRSIHWIETADSALFDRAEHVQFGFLFPLPCEDVFAPQRKLHEVADQLTFGGKNTGTSSGLGLPSSISTPTTNFHTLKWHEFVNRGLRHHTTVGAVGRKHVAVVLRSLGRGRTMSKTSSASRLLRRGNGSLSPHTPPTSHTRSLSSSSFSSEKFFGHGTFCAEDMTKQREVCVPLTLGGRLLGRLQLRVSLKQRAL